MKIYTLNNINVSEYFNWEVTEKNLSVSSICADSVISSEEKAVFGCAVNKCIYRLLQCEELSDYKMYAVFNKAIFTQPTRADNYKGIWRSEEILPYINSINVMDEITSEHESFCLYSGIAYIPDVSGADLFSIIDKSPYINMLFLSRHDIDQIYHDIVNTMFLESKKTPKINYSGLCKKYCTGGNIFIRYGTSSVDIETAIIYCTDDFKCPLDLFAE